MARVKQRTLRIDLGFLGDDWTDAHVDVRRLRWADLARYDQIDTKQTTNKDAEKLIADALADVFVAGRAPSESGELIDLTAIDLKDLDIEAQTQIYRRAMGEIDPNG